MYCHEDEKMNVKIEKQDKNLVKLDIEIDEKTATDEYNKSCRRLAQRVNIPGFRKGKAPKNVLEKHIGVEAIQRDSLESMLPNIFAKAITDNKLDVISEPYLESYNFENGKPVSVVAKIELKPEVKISNYKGIEVEVESFKNEDDAVEKELQGLADKFSTMEVVSGRETKGTDVVMMDFDGSVEGEAIKGGSAKNYMLDLGNSNFIPGFAEQLVGKNAGEDFTIEVKFPDEYHDEVLKGKPAQFKIKINEIKEKIKPQMNDEFAKKVGPFETFEAMKKDITSYLESSEKNENEKRSSNKVFQAILDNTQVDIQDTMIEREANALKNEFIQKIQQSGMTWEQIIEKEGHEKIWAELREEAANRIKNSLMISEIAKIENLQVNAQDLEAKFTELAAVYGTDKGAIMKELSRNPGLIQSLSQQALSQKVTKFLLDNNTVKFVDKK